MIDTKPRYEFCDLNIVPCVVTDIESRSECSIYVDEEKKTLPLFASPMSSVVDENNYQYFINNGITPIIHRNVSFEKRYELIKKGIWCALSLDEFEDIFCKYETYKIYDEISDQPHTIYALLDIANGHMSKGMEMVHRSKEVADEHNAELKVMLGNIANPEAYMEYAKAGVDYCRIGIGGGGMCLTTPNTGIHYPMASLVDEIRQLRDSKKIENLFQEKQIYDKYFTYPKIVADGSIKNFDNINVALACGADYVMIGTVFSSCFESAGKMVSMNCNKKNSTEDVCSYDSFIVNTNPDYSFRKNKHLFILNEEAINEWKNDFLPKFPKLSVLEYDLLNDYGQLYLSEENLKDEDIKHFLIKYVPLGKESYGMSSRTAQIEHLKMLGKEVTRNKLKTSEGKNAIVPIKYTLNQWTDNFKSFLKSTMSYTDCVCLEEFCSGDIVLIPKSRGVWECVNK